MRIVARSTLRDFLEARAGTADASALAKALDDWFDVVRKARWASMAELKQQYATASVVTADRVVFNIRGNNYRLVASVNFSKAGVWIKFIGTHADYDRIDVRTVQHGL